MSEIENTIFNKRITKRTIYARYEDYIFITTQKQDTFNKRKQTFEENFILKFTVKLNNNEIPFLDLLIRLQQKRYI